MTWRNRNLYLIGLPGAGKSAIGAELEKLIAKHNFEFVDLDGVIEGQASKSIQDIFRSEGEEHFRRLETNSLLEIASSNQRSIVATGGGIVLNPLNRAILRGSGVLIWIDVTTRQAAANVLKDVQSGKQRPMFAALNESEIQEKVRTLLDARRPFYEEAQLHFVTRSPKGDEYTPAELAEQLLIALDGMSLRVALHPAFKTILAKSALGDYPIFVGSGCAQRELPHQIKSMSAQHVVIVNDSNVAALYGEEYHTSLSKALGAACSLHTVTIPAGEAHKRTDSLFNILGKFQEFGLTRRNAVIVALGGGVTTDVAGLAANLYHRGLPIISIPTTLIAQADAAIGGKTGIDHNGVKNSLGTFYPPKHILIDPTFLKTLPERELHAGLAEVFKYALIGSRALWNELSPIVRRLIRGVDKSYEDIIHQSVLEKLRYVEADEFERASGVRELLNFGHTFGHALEAATDFKSLIHGEAVLLGMRGASWLSKELGHITEQTWSEIEVVLGRIPVKGEINATAEQLLVSFNHDKKHAERDKFRVILLRDIGAAFVTEVSENDVNRTIEYILSLV
jgi:shikimate kinase / 3-dehydroquinate synthase